MRFQAPIVFDLQNKYLRKLFLYIVIAPYKIDKNMYNILDNAIMALH